MELTRQNTDAGANALGYPPNMSDGSALLSFSRPPRERRGRVMGYVVRYNRDQKRGAGGGRKKKEG